VAAGGRITKNWPGTLLEKGAEPECPGKVLVDMSLNFTRCDEVAQVEHALLYASEFGWLVLPCHSIVDGHCTCRQGIGCVKGAGKHPRTRSGLRDASSNPDVIRAWWEKWPTANVVIATGGVLVAIDKDPRHGGDESLAKLEAKLGPLPRTRVVGTGGGGEHIYLAVPPGVHISSSSNKLAPGIDVKGEGGYVIAAPSTHRSGEPYFWKRLQLGDSPKLPAVWLAALTQAAVPLVTGGKKGDTICALLNVERVRPVMSSRRRPADQVCDVPVTDGLLSPFHDVGRRIWASCQRSLVTQSGTTNQKIVGLMTSLRNIPELNTVPAEAVRPAVHWWWKNSAPNMSVKAWDEVWKRFKRSWDNWANPETGSAWRAAQTVASNPLSGAAKRYRKPAKQCLAALCVAMQDEAGAGVWYLSWRTAKDVLASMGHEVSLGGVGKWLRQFVADGFLAKPWEHEPGSLFAQRYQTADVAARHVGGDHQVRTA
jgi:hypothetical protein